MTAPSQQPTPRRWPPLRRALVSLNAASGSSHLAQFGLVYPLLALWLTAQGVSAGRVGLVGAFVWLGMLAGGLLAPAWLARSGARRVALAGCLISALVAPVLPWLEPSALALWLPLAALFGLSCGWRWIGIESWLFSILPAARRGRLIGLHESIIYAAEALGLGLLAVIGVASGAGFMLAALAAAAALVAVCIAPAPTASQVSSAPAVWRGLHRSASARLGIVSGFINGALFGMITVYFVGRGLSEQQAALIATFFGAGSLLAQMPLGWLADRHGNRAAARAVAACGVLGAGLLFVPAAALWLPSVLLGAAAAGSLTVASLITAEHTARSGGDLGQTISQLSVTFTLGSVLGPLAAGQALESAAVAYPVLALAACAAFWVAAGCREPLVRVQAAPRPARSESP